MAAQGDIISGAQQLLVTIDRVTPPLTLRMPM